jgi:hypothetical protein
MTVHLIKLCVGADSPEDLAAWVSRRVAERRKKGEAELSHHDTRMWPKRSQEVLAGGSLYWVIKGSVLVRQRIAGLVEIEDETGRPACRILLEPALIRTEPRARRPFQGWRYLSVSDAPPDLDSRTRNISPELAIALKDALAW